MVEYEGLYAIGSGRDFALGAIHAVYDSLPAAKIAEAGMAASCDFDDSAQMPMTRFSVRAK